MREPPPGWRYRSDAFEFRRAVAELARAEAEVLRAEERLRVAAPWDDDWETIYEWADDDSPGGPLPLLAMLGALRATRDRRVREVEAVLIRWHDEDRKRG